MVFSVRKACSESMETQLRIKNIKKEQTTQSILHQGHGNVSVIPRTKVLPVGATLISLGALDFLDYKDSANVWKALEDKIDVPSHVAVMEKTERKLFECFDIPCATTMNGYDQNKYFPRSYENLQRNIHKEFVFSLQNNPLAPMYGFYENNSYACATRLLLLPENCNKGEILCGKFSLDIREKFVAEGRWTVLETRDGEIIVRTDCKFSRFRSLLLSWNVDKEGFDLVTFYNGNPEYLVRKSDVVIDISYNNPSFSEVFGRKEENQKLFSEKCTRTHYYEIIFKDGKYQYVSTDDSWRFCSTKLEESEQEESLGDRLRRSKSMVKARSAPTMPRNTRTKTKQSKRSARFVALDIHEQAKGNRQRKMIKDNLKNKKNSKRSNGSFKMGVNAFVGSKKRARKKTKSKKETRKRNRWN